MSYQHEQSMRSGWRPNWSTLKEVMLFAPLALCLVSALAPAAQAYEAVLTDRYVLRDDESLVTARQRLHARLRDEAARQAGTYVARRETLSGSELEESITVLTASMIESNTLSERVSLTGEGRPRLELSVRMSVDDSVLSDLIDTLHNDQAQIDEVEQLRHMMKWSNWSGHPK